MNSCAGTSMSVPNNWGGYQQPASGNAYGAFATYANMPPTYREYVGGNLTTPLTIGTKYFVSFKVALSINSTAGGNCASNKIGALFSTVAYPSSTFSLFGNTPPVYTDSIIVDTTDWTMISGSFIADSNYTHIIIGNFFDDAHTSVVNLAAGFSDFAYYYLDDVKLSTDSAFVEAGIEDRDAFLELNVFPVPFTKNLSFSLNNQRVSEILLFDLFARNILKVTFTNSVTLNTEKFSKGIYFYEVRDKNGLARIGKVVKE